MFINFLHNITFLLFLFLGIGILIRNRKAAINRSIFLLMIMFSIWSLGISFFQNIYVDKNTANIFLKISNFAAIGYGVFSFVSVGLFTKIIKSSIYLYVLIICYLITYIIIDFKADIFILGQKNAFGFWEVLYNNKLIIIILNILHNTLIISSFIILFLFIRKTNDELKSIQAKIILTTGLIAFILASFNVFAHLIIDSIEMPYLVDACMLIFAFGLVYSIIKYDLFNITPTILLEQIIETMPIGFVLADEQKKILRVNDKVKDITNQQSSFFINRNLKDLIVEITNSTIDIENDIFFYKKTELSLLNNNKSVVFYFKPITDKHNRILAFVLMINDIEQLVSTEKKLAKHNLLLEKRVKERTEDLLLAKEKAEESNKLKTAFLQNISHEIRTPLNAISGFSGLLNIPDLSEEKRKKFVSIIQNSSNQLASMVTDILTISSLETKQIKSNIDKVCLNHIITDLLVTFKQQAIKNNISLNAKQTLTDKQSEIFTDKTKLIQILTNLINNALKFTHQGFIEFGYSLINNNLEFYVKDSGIGIDPKYHEKIFERFGKINTSTTKLFRGTGIGLPISKEYVELLGGKIWVLSEANKGSSFYFTIPYKPVFEIDNNPTLIKQNKNSRIVLVAEDEEYNFFYIKELLINKDIKIIRAKNGKETVEIFKEIPDIALILMDIKMPVMTGYEAAKIIKKLKPDLPIIAQSAYALYEREKYERIFDDYIIKPIDGDYLLQKILKYIEH